MPKRIALIHPERIAAALARFMRGMARLGAPLERFLSATTDLILRLLPVRGEAPAVTDEEIGFMLREGVATGHIPQAETAIVEMALRLGDRRVSSVMTPRTQIEFLDLDDPRRRTAPADPQQPLFALSGRARRHGAAWPASFRTRTCSPPASPARRSI